MNDRSAHNLYQIFKDHLFPSISIESKERYKCSSNYAPNYVSLKVNPT